MPAPAEIMPELVIPPCTVDILYTPMPAALTAAVIVPLLVMPPLKAPPAR